MIQALYYDFVANYVKTRMYSTECEETGHLLPTSGGGGWGRSYTRPLPLEVKKYVVVLFSFWPDVLYKCNSGDTIPCEGA